MMRIKLIELKMSRIVKIELIKDREIRKEKINITLGKKQDSLKKKLIKLIIRIDWKKKINCKIF